MKTFKIEIGKSDNIRLNNLVKNADFRNTKEINNYYTIYFPGIIYKIKKTILNQFQRQKMKLVLKEAA